MMNAIKELYISKSFCMLGDTLSHCYNCDYCRLQDHGEFHYHTLPSEVSPILTHVPVVINCFYGDPVLQWENTQEYLDRLTEAKHRGPVIIITKGSLDYIAEQLNNYTDIDLHVALSTIGTSSIYDRVSWETFQENLLYIERAPNVKFSCEFRPVMYGVNDTWDQIEPLFRLCSEYNLPVGYSGLQGDNITQEFWNRNRINLQPFPGYQFTIKKPVSVDCANLIKQASKKWNVPIFKKTSCLISYVHGLSRDYNAHYYRPNEMECGGCLMEPKCFSVKKEHDESHVPFVPMELPFNYRLEHRDRHKCMMHDTCPHPHSDCTKLNGKLIVIEEPISTADVRVIKWLTGYTVAANFTESNFISEKWRAFKFSSRLMSHTFFHSYGGNKDVEGWNNIPREGTK